MNADARQLPPKPAEIREARKKAGMSQAQAARLVHVNERLWRYWEAGTHRMPAASWELFLLKLAQDAEAQA